MSRPTDIDDEIEALGLAPTSAAREHGRTCHEARARRVPPPWIEAMRQMSQRGWPILIQGPAGSGKSTSVRMLAEEKGVQLKVIQAHRSIGVDELRGFRSIDENGTRFDPGVLTTSLTEPGCYLLIEEVNCCPPAALAILNTLVDDSGYIVIPETATTVLRPPEWRMFLTMNGGYAGTSPVNQALVSRCFVVEAPYDREFSARMLRAKFPGLGRDRIERVLRIADAVREARRNGTTEFDFSLRTMEQLVQRFLDRGNLARAFEELLPAIGPEELCGEVRSGLLAAVKLIESSRRVRHVTPF